MVAQFADPQEAANALCEEAFKRWKEEVSTSTVRIKLV